ncbi:hypothetical protein BT69DRAFT_1350294 [Atractiella rhizophila]|nr:hypothetical protein BT69DRAFT_1350294 [Atractiella rhizophila]
MTNFSDNNKNPSKFNAQVNQTIGGVKETVGHTLNLHNLAQSGTEQRHRGEAEKEAAKAKGYAEGTGDRVTGKKDNIVGALTNDRDQQMSGQARADKGEVKQNVNS